MAHIKLASDPLTLDLWAELQREAESYKRKEPSMASLIHARILDHVNFADALINVLAGKLATQDFSALTLRNIFKQVIEADEHIIKMSVSDMMAVIERDPSCSGYVQCFLYFKGFQAVQTHRFAHALHKQGRDLIAYYLQSRSSELFGVDINPAARIGSGLFLDHATGFVLSLIHI